VRFSDVTVREYAMVVQDVDISKRTVALALDWYFIEYPPQSVDAYGQEKNFYHISSIVMKHKRVPMSEHLEKRLHMPLMEDKPWGPQLTSSSPIKSMMPSSTIMNNNIANVTPAEEKIVKRLQRSNSIPMMQKNMEEPLNKKQFRRALSSGDSPRLLKRSTSLPLKTGIPTKLLRIIQFVV